MGKVRGDKTIDIYIYIHRCHLAIWCTLSVCFPETLLEHRAADVCHVPSESFNMDSPPCRLLPENLKAPCMAHVVNMFDDFFHSQQHAISNHGHITLETFSHTSRVAGIRFQQLWRWPFEQRGPAGVPKCPTGPKSMTVLGYYIVVPIVPL